MSDSPLMVKSKAFALDIIRICNAIHEAKHESILTKQLVRSGTSIGANIREAFFAFRDKRRFSFIKICSLINLIPLLPCLFLTVMKMIGAILHENFDSIWSHGFLGFTLSRKQSDPQMPSGLK